jgi:E3 ubiquitin-protein ligase HERC2
LGHPRVERELLPKPVEALRGVRVGSIAAHNTRSYAVADTGLLWAWGCGSLGYAPLGHGKKVVWCLPKPIESLRGIKFDAVTTSSGHTLARADDGSVYVWGCRDTAFSGALGLGPVVSNGDKAVLTPQRVPMLRVACAGPLTGF